MMTRDESREVMDGFERIIGKLEEFRDTTKDRLDRIDNKLESLQSFRWKIIGGSAAISFIFGALGAIVGMLK